MCELLESTMRNILFRLSRSCSINSESVWSAYGSFNGHTNVVRQAEWLDAIFCRVPSIHRVPRRDWIEQKKKHPQSACPYRPNESFERTPLICIAQYCSCSSVFVSPELSRTIERELIISNKSSQVVRMINFDFQPFTLSHVEYDKCDRLHHFLITLSFDCQDNNVIRCVIHPNIYCKPNSMFVPFAVSHFLWTSSFVHFHTFVVSHHSRPSSIRIYYWNIHGMRKHKP